MENLSIEMRLDGGGRRIHISPNRPIQMVVEGAKWFSFELCRKTTQLGPVAVDHFWMPIASVYEQRNRAARNYSAIVEYYWARCMKHATVFDEHVQESYILAKLLPLARSNGSRRVFDDAVLTSPGRLGVSKRQIVAELDNALAGQTQRETDIVSFRDATARLLGPPDFDDRVKRRYEEIAGDLLGHGRTALQRWGPIGLAVPLQKWRRRMTAVGRRSGNALDKQVLDILSYECRAALHRCYSATWEQLLRHLDDKYDLSANSIVFHRFWHLDQCQEQGRRDSLFHLFHGHVFALHPAAALFSLTSTGARLLGEWLLEPEPGPAYGRLLTGLLISVGEYARWAETAAFLRRTGSQLITGFDIEEKHAAQITRPRRRRCHRSSAD